MWILRAAYSFFCTCMLDFVFFILVDVVAKSLLKDARSNEEKWSIWLYESLVLTLISVGIYLFDHVPYILIILTAITFVYTQLCGRVDFSFWWRLLITRWEEYQQHQESQKLLKERQKQIQQVHHAQQQQQQSSSEPVQRVNVHYPVSPNMNQRPTYARPPAASRSQFPMPYYNPTPASWSKPLQTKNLHITPQYQIQKEKLDESLKIPKKMPSTQTETVNNPPKSGWFGSELKRRPLRSETRGLSIPANVSISATKFKSKFMSALGFPTHTNEPVGLKNGGRNVCFMNSVFQCLARTPKLVPHLLCDINKDTECSVSESVLLNTLVEVLQHCSAKPGVSGASSLDPASFRQVASTLNGVLVAPLAQKQHQQDCAEFFMWLMETVHNTLNKNHIGQQSVKQTQIRSPTVSMLKFLYGDLTPQKIQDLKEACKREIDLANGLDNDSYAESIKKLADLEWLTQKQANNSVIDDIFTGQLVIAYHCLADNHISVNMQTFRVLPVPIVSPREVSGLVFLEDCFTRFCNIEHLFGQDLQECSWCNKNRNFTTPPRSSYSQSMTRTPQMNSHRFGSVDSALQSPSTSTTFMSPIVGSREIMNDSGFHDNAFKTSTPVGENTLQFNLAKKNIRDGQRRCLLRQLPDCLVIQLMRFGFNQVSRQSRKIHAAVSIPLKGLDLSSIIYDTVANREDVTGAHAHYKYDLYGVCVHLGADSTNFGHYVSYCLCNGDRWFKFDDEVVTEVNMDYEITTRVLRENSYLLFYKRSPK